MTCYVVLKFLERHNLDPKNIKYITSLYSSSVSGTSANLEKGDIICVHDLLFGLMLPSGNDAALALAEIFGLLLTFEETEEIDKIKETVKITNKIKKPYGTNDELNKVFIKEMNKTARTIGL
jgi:D-alanyl-D-alanine carboxypeptidase (penicillin-binding protein 5/6)